MKHSFLKVLCVILTICAVLSLVTMSGAGVSAASTEAQLRQQQKEAQQNLDKLKKQKADQTKIQAALEKEIAATQALIDACNAKINRYNNQIAQKQAEIDQKNAQIEADKRQFKKRIRAIYMSNTDSSVQLMLSAENFSDYLTLAEMAKRVSAHDKAMIDRIVDAIAEIQAQQEEIRSLLDEQAAVKAEIAEQKAKLDGQMSEVKSVIDHLNHDIAADQAAYNKISDQLASMSASGGGGGDYNGYFLWPSANYFYVSAGFNSGDSVHNGNHKGIDIAGSGIKGTPIRAAAAGTVYASNNSCSHNYNKNYSCGCGGGYGNYVAIDHNVYEGNHYKTLYGHMTSTCVSVGQHVERGQVIGYVGTTGWSTGPHIHFEIIKNGVKVNPMNFSFSR